MHFNLCAFLAVLLSLAAASMPAPGASFRGLGDLPGGGFGSDAYAVSADGSASGGDAFRWTSAGGMIGLGQGHPPGGANDVSGDGSVVVGYSSSASDATGFEAFRWTSGGGMVGLGVLPGQLDSWAAGTSNDGSVVVGHSYHTVGGEAFRWTSVTGMQGLGYLSGGGGSIATRVSGDGSVVGFSFAASGAEPFRWTSGDGIVGLGDLPGGHFYSAYALSAPPLSPTPDRATLVAT